MQQKAWSAKRERQYAHIKDSLLESGKPESLAQEIAARVVNKERAQHGETVTASASSINDCPLAVVAACAPTKTQGAEPCFSFATRPANAV
jgi:hypothetical protein